MARGRGRGRGELRNEVLLPYEILELDPYHQHCTSEASLAADHKSTELFEHVLDAVRPRLLFVRGPAPREHMERLLGIPLKTDGFTITPYRGHAIDVFVATRQLAYVAGGEACACDVGGRVKCRLQELTVGSSLPTRPAKSAGALQSPGRSKETGVFSLGAVALETVCLYSTPKQEAP